MFRFDAERFRKLDLRYQDVAASMVKPGNLRVIEVHVLSQNGAAINAFVVDGDLVLRNIIINDHLARADDDHLAHLLRVQPAYMNVCDDLPGILKAKKDNIIDAILHVSHALAANGNRLRIAKPILDDADIVRGKIPEGVDIGTDAPEIQPLAIDVTKVTQLAGINKFLHITDGRVVDEGVASHDNEISLGSTSGKFINLRNLGRQRFLHEDVFTSIEDLLGKGEVACSRSGDDHSMDAGIFQNGLMIFDCATEREVCFHESAPFCSRIYHVLNRTAGERREITEQIRAPIATSELGKDYI